MSWFLNLKTANKILLEFGVIGILVVGIGFQGLRGLATIEGNLSDMYKRDIAGMDAVQEARLNQAYAARAVRSALLATDKEEVRKQCADVKKFAGLVEQFVLKFESTIVTPEARTETVNAKALIAAWFVRNDKIFKAIDRGDTREALSIINGSNADTLKLRTSLVKMVENKEKLIASGYQNSLSAYESARNTMAGILLLAFLVSIGLAVGTSRVIAAPLVLAAKALDQVAQGNLTATLNIDSKDEVGQMASSLRKALTSMKGVMIEVTASSKEMADASRELASASQTLASGVHRHAAGQVETSATLEELSTTVRQNANNAQQANGLAADAHRSAENGATVVSSAIQAMEEVNQASSKIADIIGTVDEIAFQTNLLALNAAVEAARAGDLGRGFAVVATEIRSLSHRSALAAKEIKTLIQDSLLKVGNASGLVHQSGKTLKEVLDSGKQVVQFATEIAQASREQAAGIEQAASAMNEMDQVTQANSSQTEELSATAENLAFAANNLQKAVEYFKLA
jgi:methyl-accepting chemotaxis protein